MLNRAFVILIVIFFSIIVAGTTSGSDLIMKKPVKILIKPEDS
jgi:hypothetical protein